MKISSKSLRILLTLAIIVSSLAAYCQTFEIVGNSRSNLELSLKIDKFTLEDNHQDGVDGKTITLSGIFLPNEAGMPDLPVVSRYVAIPRGANVVLSVNKQVTETISDVDIMPAPALPLDNDNTPMRYVRDEAVYSTDAFFPAEPYIVSKPMKIRDVDMALISVTPFQYNPVTRELVVTRELDFEVVFEAGADGIGDFGGDPRYRSEAWDHIIRDMVINESILPDANYQNFIREAVQNRDTGCEYLIICPDNPEFLQLADSIKLFRNQQGILTDVVTVSECGGNNQTAIRNYIRNAYTNWDIPVSAVLLLGDHTTDGTQGIVSYTMNNHPGGDGYNPYISDNKYGDVNNDHLPEVVIGRITGRDYDEMYHMINKDIQAERHPSTNPHFYDKPITAMGFQLERWFQLCSEVVNGFWEYELGKHPVRVNAIYEGNPGSWWSSADHTNAIVNYFGPSGLGYIPQNMSHLTEWNGTGNQINDAINAGAFILQHRDHGAEELWGEPSYSISHINRLANPDLTFVMSNNCLTGRFNYTGGIHGMCFAEAFHRHQYGALGIIAATEVSYSFVNDVYVWGVYDHMWPDFMPTYGTQHPKAFVLPAYGNAAGKFFLSQSNWTDDYVKEITYYLFHHHGDVYMNLYTEMPQELDVTVIPVIMAGSSQFQLTATENATICISKGNEIIGLATATGQPQTIAITPQIIGEEVLLTITKQDYYRYTERIPVIPNEGPYLIFSSCDINDYDGNSNLDFNEEASLNVALHNVGDESIQNINATLTSDSPYVIINSSSATYESFNPNEIVSKANAFSIRLTNDVPDQAKIVFNLTMSNATHSFSDSFYLVANAPKFEVTHMELKDMSGNPVDRLYKGETSQITFTVNNQGHSNSNNVNHHLLLDENYIGYQQQTITTEGINVNDSTDVTFIVTVKDWAPYGDVIDSYLTVTSDGYEEVAYAEVSLGNCTEDFEGEELNPLFQWSNTGKPWVKDDNDPYEGNYCYTSTSTSANPSKLALGVTTDTDDVISFYYKGSENATDQLYFIHNTQQYALSGHEWQYFEMPIEAGSHVFKWTFARKSGAATGSASIDLIKLPPMRVLTGIEENVDTDDMVTVYPNPGNNELNIIVSENNFAKLQLFDFQGRMILEKDIDSEITTINTEHLATGMYFWKVGNEVGKWIKSR
ncbi:MAG: T9SS type A sorting domain-containing protein [Bacteroidales bacterium]|nr:T9SS type A sorting domain-containing protein [Bacteroidales bacterium]